MYITHISLLDFIFSVYTSNFGLIGTIILITLLLSFDLALFKLAKDTNDKNYRFIISGFLAMILFKNIYKFLFPRKEELYFSLKEIFTFCPHNLELYKLALLHKSMLKTDSQGHHLDNERLEFLGDAIIEAVVSNYLFRKYQEEQEGFLTTMRSKLVRRSTLNQISKRIGLDNLIKASITAGTHNSFIGGNAFEALVGAAYLDRGYRKCQQFFLSLIARGYLNPDNLAQKEENFKSLLLEWCQKNRIIINFETDELNPEICRKMPSFITRGLFKKRKPSTSRPPRSGKNPRTSTSGRPSH